MMASESYLFDPSVLTSLNWSLFRQNDSTGMATIQDPSMLAPNLRLRPLKSDDHRRSYVQLLSQLTIVGDISESQYVEQFKRMKESGLHLVVVIEDDSKQLIVGTITLVIGYKFLYGTAPQGWLENAVVLKDYRHHGLGTLLVNTVKLLSIKYNVYRLLLNCRDDLISFYTMFGFKMEDNMMAVRFWE